MEKQGALHPIAMRCAIPLLSLLLAAGACNTKGRPAAPSPATPTVQNPAGPKLEMQTYGESSFPDGGARARVARAYGFSYRAVAGCVVTKELVQDANTNNLRVDSILTQLHGTGWKERFEKDVLASYALEGRIRAAALANPEIAAAQKALNTEGKGLMFEPAAAGPDGTHEVAAYTYADWQGKLAYVTQYRLHFRPADSSVRILSTDRTLFRALN